MNISDLPTHLKKESIKDLIFIPLNDDLLIIQQREQFLNGTLLRIKGDTTTEDIYQSIELNIVFFINYLIILESK